MRKPTANNRKKQINVQLYVPGQTIIRGKNSGEVQIFVKI